ncbi:glucose transport transcription regulator RGT1 [Achaetomium macrosporum]|uniref:Glucose transport transcription regulator RGT1 n=1 Tax=Achaetomium macrosporum TaxID=79813 RepID=A0AAN7C329_9PEZI|nr:glucose transport transcription regulator RGT1 [Achaetomium macrosporum]
MEDKKPPPDGEDVAMQQTYPSPMVDSAEAQYYEQLTQHRELEPEVGQQPAQPEHHGLPSMPQHQEPQEEHHELHRLQELQEPSTTQQQNARAPVNTDELQLTAQLTQELAPMMAAGVEDQTQGQQPIPQQEPHAQQHPEAEPDLQEQLQASLQNHEREMQSHEHDLQNNHHSQHHHHHELQSHGLQDMLPHSSQPQPDHYPQNSPAPPHPNLPHHMSMGHHLPSARQPQYQLPGATPPRKRTKVSRACDECRRKKIKCDAQSEASEEPCSNCRRSNTQCLFSRVPQKRGPSKGYIKELADRINTIEGKLNTSVEGLERRTSTEAFASPGPDDNSRKRPFSSISRGNFQTPSPNTMASIATEHRPILPYVQPDFRASNSGNPNDLAPRPLVAIQIPGGTNNVGVQGQSEMMDGMSHNELPQASVQPADQLPEIEDAAFNKYLEVIHPTFPVLASTKARVQSLLWQAPMALQTAFYTAFLCMVGRFLPESANQANGDPATACRQLSDWEAEPKPDSAVTNLLRLQTLVMALIAVDCHGLSSIKGELGGPSKAEILARAVGLGYSMKLYAREIDPNPNPELDPNSDDNVALRTWYVLVMLDRWNAVGMAAPVMINNDSVLILAGLKHVVGDVVFNLIRISYILGYLAPLTLHATADPFAPWSSLPSLAAEMLRWLFPADLTNPVVHLAYWHIQLLSRLCSPLRHLDHILQMSKNMVALLAGNHELVTPLTHHFVALVSLGLLDLARGDDDGTRDEAAKLMKDIIEYSLMPSPWNDAVRKKLAEHLPGPETAHNSKNPRQLANLATAVEGGGTIGAPAAAAAATAEDDVQPKEEPHVATTSGAASVAGGGGTATQPGEIRDAHGDDGDTPRQPVADLQAMLRAGYLTCFEEPAA